MKACKMEDTMQELNSATVVTSSKSFL